MVDTERLMWILDLLVDQGMIHAGQRQDVLNRGRDQARHILLDKRAQMRRMLGRHRVAYRVTAVELIASFRFNREDKPSERLDEEVVTADDRRRLQAMGVVLGDLLAEALDMHWVIYEDQVGRSRALRYRQSDNYLFPATMVSRRREAGDLTPVQEIYDKAVGIIRPVQEPLPFQ